MKMLRWSIIISVTLVIFPYICLGVNGVKVDQRIKTVQLVEHVPEKTRPPPEKAAELPVLEIIHLCPDHFKMSNDSVPKKQGATIIVGFIEERDDSADSRAAQYKDNLYREFENVADAKSNIDRLVDFISVLLPTTFLTGLLVVVAAVLLVVLACWYFDSSIEPHQEHMYQMTDYERVVVYGETRRGWQFAIPKQHLFLTEHDSPIVSSYLNSSSIWTNDGDPKKWAPVSSVVLPIMNQDEHGNYIVCVNQYSLIKPNSSTTFLKVISDRDSHPLVSVCYLSSRIILVACRLGDSAVTHIVLIDVIARSSRTFRIEIPVWMNVCFTLAYVSSDPKPRLHIVFEKCTSFIGPNTGGRFEFIVMKYDCNAPNGSLLEPLSSESIEFPVGNRVTTRPFFSGGFPIASLAYDSTDLPNHDKHLCVSFDCRKKGWRMETLTQWAKGFLETQEGVSVLNAAIAYSYVIPPMFFEELVQISVMRTFRQLFAVPGRNEILATMPVGAGILRRLVKTPSMKTSAAMSIFRAHPELKIGEVEEATGVEISDGIREEKKEEEDNTLYL